MTEIIVVVGAIWLGVSVLASALFSACAVAQRRREADFLVSSGSRLLQPDDLHRVAR